MKTKTCKTCKLKFKTFNSFQKVCSSTCAIKLVQHKKEKEAKDRSREINKKKRELKQNNKSFLIKKAQEIVNKYIRLRDLSKPCISCGYKGDSRQWHAGHYRPAGRNSALRFNENNIHKQCSICNNHLSGNLVLYRSSLIKKIGLNKVLEIERNNNPKSWSIDELKELIETYRIKTKEIK